MHVSLSENIYKDFSSGKAGGIMQFCRDMLHLQGRSMTLFEVAAWMLSEGISTDAALESPSRKQRPSILAPGLSSSKKANRAITIDLRRYLCPDHPELHRRGISPATCRYLGCGFLPQRTGPKAGSPLNRRIVFQIRGVTEDGPNLEPVILSHTGRALSPEQEASDGKYWSYPFRKGLELYNQDQLLLDEQARSQACQCGLILVEGFFDVAKLVESGCRNVVALMGNTLSEEQIERLMWIRSRIHFAQIVLFLDRDQAGTEGAQKARQRLSLYGIKVSVFDWNQSVRWPDEPISLIAASIQDPAEMSVNQLRCLRSQGII
jgi:5S rRNA maturation endonuclease (ribonuclease M5)